MLDGMSEPRFLCDAMLGSLARWLRFLGYDCAYPPPGEDDELLARRAREEGRWLLTRDRVLASAGPRTVLLRSETVDDQLAEVLRRLDLAPEPDLDRARCSACNGVLEPAAVAEVENDVPPHVARTASRFRRCAGCGRVYWPGSHGERIRRRLQAAVRAARR